MDQALSTHQREVETGQRFQFGANWQRFLSVLSEDRIEKAVESLKTGLGCEDLQNKHFLDIGCGSGLFSLAAHRLGAHVYSFDYDAQSVACTQELRQRYFPDSGRWTVKEGSVLDQEYLRKLGQFDVVYSWGVLHHTGDMWQAFANAAELVKPGGQLYIAIYNDQGSKSRLWTALKRTYNRLPSFLKPIYGFVVMGSRELVMFSKHLLRFRLGRYFAYRKHYANFSQRGMNYWYDMIDWLGGYPFEVAQPDEIFEFFYKRGFELQKLVTIGSGHGCNDFGFVRKR